MTTDRTTIHFVVLGLIAVLLAVIGANVVVYSTSHVWMPPELNTIAATALGGLAGILAHTGSTPNAQDIPVQETQTITATKTEPTAKPAFVETADVPEAKAGDGTRAQIPQR
jgi:hypothetical protein